MKYGGNTMTKTALLNKARHHCANWNQGKCLGVIIVYDNKNQRLHHHIAKDRLPVNKDCKIVEGCEYFETTVAPGL